MNKGENKIPYLGGVSGVGKTSLLRSLQSEITFHIFDPPKEMLGQVNTNERDDLDLLSLTDRRRVRTLAFSRIMSMPDVSRVIIDGHFSLSNEYGHEWALPIKYLDRLGPFILIFASPEYILERRIKDKGRERDQLSLEDIELDLSVERLYAKYIAQKCGQSLFEVENDDINRAQALLLQVLQDILP